MEPEVGRGRDFGKLSLYALLFYASGFFALLMPLPLFVLAVRRGLRDFALACGLLTVVLSALYLVFFNSPFLPTLLGAPENSKLLFFFYGMGQFAVYVAMAGFLIVAREKKWSMTRLFLVFLMCFSVGALFLSLSVYSIEHRTVYDLMRESLREIFSQMDAKQKADFDLLPVGEEAIITWMVRLSMAINFISLWWGFLAVLSLSRTFLKDPKLFTGIGEFSAWRLPFESVWVLIGGILLLFFDHYVLPVRFSVDIAVSVLVVLSSLYFLEGLAVLVFFMKRWQLSFFGRVGIYLALVLFFQLVGAALLAIGFGDMWLDMRHLEKEKKSGSDFK